MFYIKILFEKKRVIKSRTKKKFRRISKIVVKKRIINDSIRK